MIQFTGRLYKLDFDVKGYRKSYDDEMKIQMRQAAREWLRAVYPHVPVYTGMARSSLKPLGRLLKVAIPITQSKNGRKRERPGYSRSDGEAQGVFSFGDNENGVYTFSFDTQVLHYYLNDTFDTKGAGMFNLINKTPWESAEYGEKAFRTYVEKVMPGRLPRIADHIIYSAVTRRG